MKITFLGAAEEVTGSRYLIEQADTHLLVDCGLFQGTKEIREHNWDTLPIQPHAIDAITLTHAHIDHIGYIPALIKKGFRGKIYCSKATYELAALLLIDSGSVQEQNSKKTKRSPLYTVKDAEHALTFFQPIAYERPFTIGASLTVTLIPSYHIIGSSFIIISDGTQKLTFSGDLGRPNRYLMKAPTQLKETDFLVLESTYGNRLHEHNDPIKELGDILHEAIKKHGTIIIPAFAVERTQTIIYCLYQLKKTKVIPDIPVFLDSPLAIKVSDLFCKFPEEHKLSLEVCRDIFKSITYIHAVQESKQIDHLQYPAIIIAGSGMADGGRVLDHFKHFISDTKNTVIFTGFQSRGTNGYALTHDAKSIKIDDKVYSVRADIKTIGSFSSHADYNDTLEWLSHFQKTPKKVFLTHGEKESAIALKKRIEDRFGWTVEIPAYLDSFELD